MDALSLSLTSMQDYIFILPPFLQKCTLKSLRTDRQGLGGNLTSSPITSFDYTFQAWICHGLYRETYVRLRESRTIHST